MLLTLVNSCNIYALRGDESGYYNSDLGRWLNNFHFSGSVILPLPSDSSSISSECQEEREIAKKFMSAITAGNPSTLEIDLINESADCGYRVVVRSAPNSNILENLWKQFGDKVKVSLVIENSHTGYIVLSTAGMKIDASNYTCTLNHYVALNSLEDSHQYNLTVIASIDDFELTRQSQFDGTCKVKKTNKNILEGGLGSDVIILAGNGVEIKCHRCFLTASSSVFRSMFGNDMKESKTGQVDMTDLSEDGVKAFLRYLYFDDRIGSSENLEIAYELLYVSHKYDVPELESWMTAYLVKREDKDFSAELAFKMYLFVRNIESAVKLKTKVVHILQMKFGDLKALAEFKEFFRKTPDHAMDLCEEFAKSPLEK